MYINEVIGLLLLAALPPQPVPSEAKGLAHLEKGAMRMEWKRHKATVLLFISTDCPIANRYAPEMERLHQTYRPKGVHFLRVYLSEPGDKAAILTHTKEFRLTMPAVLDPEHLWVRATGVRVTPEAAVIGPDGTVRYRGRIDSRNVEHGRERPNYRRDLAVALDEFLENKPISEPETNAIGCFIQLDRSQRS